MQEIRVAWNREDGVGVLGGRECPPDGPAGAPRPAPATESSPADIAGRMLGAHAQVASAAELSIALRLEGATRTDVRDALTGGHAPAGKDGQTQRPGPGRLVKTFGPRGTIHLLPARDLPWWTGALSSLPARPSPFRPEARMTATQTDEVVAAIGDALTGAELTVDELTEAIVARTGSWAADPVMPSFQTMWPRWRQVTHTAAHRGVLAFGRDRGRKVTYTNPGCAPASPTRSVHELVDRYLRAYGPATPRTSPPGSPHPPGGPPSSSPPSGGATASRRCPSRPAGPGSPPATPPSRTNPRAGCACSRTSTRT